jgi:hypothetical protein
MISESRLLKQNQMEEAQIKLSADSAGNPLDGRRNYRLHLPSGIPASEFWSVLVYDCRTGFIIVTNQSWPSIYSTRRNLAVNPDGSVDCWFGPKAPSGRENNWIQTIPGKGWYMILRLYEPLKSLYDNSWMPGEIGRQP